MKEIDQFYIIGFPKGKTHLAYINDDDELIIWCFPSCSVEYGNRCEGYGIAGREQAEQWQQYFNEVTCPTCLKKALGKPAQLSLAITP